ncbi:hypothetical protein OQJ19_07435 [Fluoribacter gormanii]|uniref:Uncharacterized protein n=1 Tax=Fluoribacter gormanii TaxID=464 RepID=A0A377GPX9_9GAMM|nr:hypothetical protein [Fluoribacter gormanii]KTD00550.1 hypothetical protein Lgor_3026 [Fluoribacter gormanii]MCW8470487.1 hypothetical protein [Fluoribacter gormanii]SIR06551.1 hypothetical protein SAMN05421777_10631 [Fluoribacter gormanii]STO26372.1 Uncharacterised protein [Fluoribacter gormanii]
MSAMSFDDGLQAMLVAQMLSIHELQQRTMAYANACDDLELKKYCTSTTVKLANCFVQQANILAKLQGVGGQKIRGKTRSHIHGVAKGSGAPRCNANALKHGGTTAKVKAFRIEIRGIVQHRKKPINEFS